LGKTWWDEEENGVSCKTSRSFKSLLADLRKDTPSNIVGLFKECVALEHHRSISYFFEVISLNFIFHLPFL
jgi:hypothetical protein